MTDYTRTRYLLNMTQTPPTQTTTVTIKVPVTPTTRRSGIGRRNHIVYIVYTASPVKPERVIEARSVKALRERLHAEITAAIADAWTIPYMWTDISGVTWSVYPMGLDEVGISKSMFGMNITDIDVERIPEWEGRPWMYLVHEIETDLAVLFDSLGRLARGETTGTCTACLTNFRTVHRDDTGAFKCPDPSCRTVNPGRAEQNAEQYLVTLARGRGIRVTRSGGKTWIWKSETTRYNIVQVAGDKVWVQCSDGVYTSETVARAEEIIRALHDNF